MNGTERSGIEGARDINGGGVTAPGGGGSVGGGSGCISRELVIIDGGSDI